MTGGLVSGLWGERGCGGVGGGVGGTGRQLGGVKAEALGDGEHLAHGLADHAEGAGIGSLAKVGVVNRPKGLFEGLRDAGKALRDKLMQDTALLQHLLDLGEGKLAGSLGFGFGLRTPQIESNGSSATARSIRAVRCRCRRYCYGSLFHLRTPQFRGLVK